MIIINANTKIATLIKQHPDALETIVSISPMFTKLRNPILRKVMGARTSIAMASKLGGCSVEDFFDKLRPLGFEIEKATVARDIDDAKKPIPEFLKNISSTKIIELDVRPIFETGKDPLKIIIQNVNGLETGYMLKIINSFEPIPLIHLLNKQGFESYTEQIHEELVNTYFYKKTDKPFVFKDGKNDRTEGWDEITNRFNGNIETVDVRALEMPLPMHTILEALEALPVNKALFVYHKRIPVFLLPELEEQHFNYRIKEISDAEVHLLIYKD